MTQPDLIVGERTYTHVALPVLNATTATLDCLTIEATLAGGETVTTPLPPLPPLSTRKAGFVVKGSPPAQDVPPNTLYNTSADGSKRGNNLAYRIYLPDRGTGAFGGVPAPKLAFILADGTRIDQYPASAGAKSGSGIVPDWLGGTSTGGAYNMISFEYTPGGILKDVHGGK